MIEEQATHCRGVILDIYHYEHESKSEFRECATEPGARLLYREAGAVPRLHLLLHEDPRALAVGGRHAGLFPGFAALSPSDGPEPGEAGIHREDTRPRPLAQAAVAPRAAAGSDLRT